MGKKRFNELEKEKNYKYKSIEIVKGKDEEEIWAIFQKIYDVLEENDEVTFDVTHSYRFLPMLGLLLLQHPQFYKLVFEFDLMFCRLLLLSLSISHNQVYL